MLERMVSPKRVWGWSGPSVRRFRASASSASSPRLVEAALEARGVGEVDHGQDRLVSRRAEDEPQSLQGLLEERPGLRRPALVEQELAQAVDHPERVLVVGAEDAPECLE